MAPLVEGRGHACDASSLDLETIRQQFAPPSRLELEYFAAVCRHLGLDPWAGQIYLIGRRQKVRDEHGRDTWQLVHKPQIAVAGRRAIASRTGRLVGIDGPYLVRAAPPRPDGAKLPLDWTDALGRRRTHSPVRGKVPGMAGRVAHPR